MTNKKINIVKQNGLSAEEVKKQQKIYGRNEIIEKFDSPLIILLKKFYSPIPLMIEMVLILSAIIGKWEDFIIIAILLGINITVEFVQQQKAHMAIRELENMIKPESFVLRDGKFFAISVKELVPEDIVKLSIGDIVPADAVLFNEGYLLMDQSSITGESLPVKKVHGDVLHAGSVVQNGSALIRITATGKKSAIGRNAQLVAKAAHTKISHFEKAIFGISKFLIVISTALILIVLTVLMLRGTAITESMRFILVLAIASIPVALPTVLSVTMAIGAKALAKRKTIVAHMQAIEDLAGVDVLCVDKTGTVTKNEIAVISPKLYGDFTMDELLVYALLATDSGHKTPIENAVYKFACEYGAEKNIASYHIKSFIPFDPTRKTTEAVIEKNNEIFTIIMGAPQVIMREIKQEPVVNLFIKDNNDFAQKGYRSLAIAKKNQKGTFIVGFLPLLDPPREDAKSIIKFIQKKGIEIKMITGDNTAIAKFIARLLSIGTHIIDSVALEKIHCSNNHQSLSSIDVFAEATPSDKYYIVEKLQKDGHIVAMTGDGTNDAPALKKADVGIAVSGAMPVARFAADIILLDSGLSVIQDAIQYARMTFARMQSYATFRISETIRIIFFITLSILLFNYTPISAVMIILLALLNDIPVMSIAYDNAPVNDKPTRWRLSETLLVSVALGIMGVISSFGLLYWLHINGYAIAIIQSIIFLKLDIAGHSTLYITRAGRKHFWQRPFPSWKFFIPAFGSRIVGILIVVYGFFMEPISWHVVLYIWIYAIIWFLLNDQIKIWTYKAIDKYSARKNHVKSYLKMA